MRRWWEELGDLFDRLQKDVEEILAELMKNNQPGLGDKKPDKKPKTEEEKDTIYPGVFDITWGENKNYWKKPDKMSKGPAELIKVCWLQVTGSKKVKTGKSYEIKFNISLRHDAFGWDCLPLFMMYKIGEDGSGTSKKIKPLEETKGSSFDIPRPDEEQLIVKIPGDKGDEKELHFGFYETQSNRWKGGLRINYATVKEV